MDRKNSTVKIQLGKARKEPKHTSHALSLSFRVASTKNTCSYSPLNIEENRSRKSHHLDSLFFQYFDFHSKTSSQPATECDVWGVGWRASQILGHRAKLSDVVVKCRGRWRRYIKSSGLPRIQFQIEKKELFLQK
jgi:hypothetical protein